MNRLSISAGIDGRASRNALGLIVLFLTIIVGVPVAQIYFELARGERVQFIDLFRYAPSAENLRRFESTLEDTSWIQQNGRRVLRRVLFEVFRDPGKKGVMGRDGWLFYRPGVRYLIEPNRVDTDESDSRWVEETGVVTARDSVARAIEGFRDQLDAHGIRLLVIPVPSKSSVYPDMVTSRAAGREQQFRSPTLDLLEDLRVRKIETVDLFSVFRESRKDNPNVQYFMARDTHWTPAGARLAAETVARKVRDMGLAPDPVRDYQVNRVPVARFGDLLEMMQLPGAQDAFPAERLECERVVDPVWGPMVPSTYDRQSSYKHPDPELRTSILVLGDSFSRIYQIPEPASLGVMAVDGNAAAASRRRLLPGSAGFLSHLMLALNAPVDYIVSDGGASTDVRKKLSTDAAALEDKKLVIWEFVEHDVGLGRDGWQVGIPLPPMEP